MAASTPGTSLSQAPLEAVELFDRELKAGIEALEGPRLLGADFTKQRRGPQNASSHIYGLAAVRQPAVWRDAPP